MEKDWWKKHLSEDGRRLDLSSTQPTSLSGVVLPANLQSLDLSGTQLTSLSDVELPANLQVLELRGTQLTSLSGVELPANLQSLDLSGTQLTSLSGVVLPTNLQLLDLCYTQLTSLSGVELPENLQYLYLSDTQLTSLSDVELPADLQDLYLSYTQLTSLSDVELPANLQRLILSDTLIKRLPESIRQLKELSILNLSRTNLEALPDWLPELGIPFTREQFGSGICLFETTVEGVDMSIFDQSQETILEWFRARSEEKVRQKVSKRIYSFFCPTVLHPGFRQRHAKVFTPQEIQTKILERIKPSFGFEPFDLAKFYYPNRFPDNFTLLPIEAKGYFRWACGRYTPAGCFANEDWDYKTYLPAWKARKPIYLEDVPEEEPEPAKPLNELKIVFLGDGEAGKSHTIARLLNDGVQVDKFRGVSTPGIVIEDKTYQIGDREVKVHFWDFGGQEILHSMHRMFLTERTLYVVMLNVREGNQDDRARYWLHNLRSFANGAPVLLVLNKMDMNKNASVNEADLRKLYPGLTDVVKLSTLTDSDEEFREKFVEVLRKQIGKMDILAFPFTAAWSRLKEKLQNMIDNYIKGNVFRQFCNDCGVKGSDTVRRDLLNWFSDLGVSFCYSGSEKLEDYVVLRPDWITNAIYIILFNKVEAVTNGLVSHDTIYRMLSSEDTEKYRRTVAEARYARNEVDYVLKVFRKFRLSFLVEDGVEFLPMLCDANSTAAAAEYENDPNTLEFRMHYEYLPNNVIHRLMVDRRKELDRTNVWLTGARFVCGDTGRSAVVKSEGNLIRILVRAEKDPRDPQRYLDDLKESLERINAIMGLTVAKMEVVYKENGISECFDYDRLLLAQRFSETHVLSMAHMKRIRLVDVLMQSDFPEDEKQKKLMADIRQACEMLQEDSLYWTANEDQRTGLLAKLLRAKNYVAMEQHRTGISAGGILSGELDLDIRLTPGDCWSALEALNLKGSSGSWIKYWNAHLKKLLDNYNDVGRSFLFHVSYVQCQKDKFGKIVSELYEHMRFYSPPGFELLRRFVQEIPLGSREEQSRFLRAVKCVYDCGGVTMTVYHYFVRIGE